MWRQRRPLSAWTGVPTRTGRGGGGGGRGDPIVSHLCPLPPQQGAYWVTLVFRRLNRRRRHRPSLLQQRRQEKLYRRTTHPAYPFLPSSSYNRLIRGENPGRGGGATTRWKAGEKREKLRHERYTDFKMFRDTPQNIGMSSNYVRYCLV